MESDPQEAKSPPSKWACRVWTVVRRHGPVAGRIVWRCFYVAYVVGWIDDKGPGGG